MERQDFSSYLTSFSVINKTSDISVKDILASIKTTDKKTLSQEMLSDFLESTAPIDSVDVSRNYNGILTKSMVINNVVANTPIPLSEQKVITRSNYEIIADVKQDIKYETRKETKKLLSDIKKVSPVQNYLEAKDIIDDISKNLEDFKQALNFDLSDTQALVDIYFEDLKELKVMTINDWKNTDSYTWREKIRESDGESGSFLYNFTVYHDGTSSNMKPKYGKFDPVSSARIALKFLSKWTSLKRSRSTGKYGNEKGGKSYFEKKGISFSVKKDLALKLSKLDSQYKKNVTRKRNNPFIDDMLKAGPDLRQNMFDVYLRFNNSPSHPSVADDTGDLSQSVSTLAFFVPNLVVNNKGRTLVKYSYAFESTFPDAYSLSVRTATVSIPMISRESATVKFLNTDVERPTNKVSFNNEGALSIDCDANTYVNDMFLALAGLQRDGYFRNGTSPTLDYIQKDRFNHTNRFPFQSAAKQGLQLSTVDLIVSSHSLGRYSDKSVNPGSGGFYSNVLYVFKDVRFLGTSNGIAFATGKDSASQAIDVPFIFKNLETYYKPDNLAYGITENVISSSLFNARNLNNEYYDETSITESLKKENEEENEDEKEEGKVV